MRLGKRVLGGAGVSIMLGGAISVAPLLVAAQGGDGGAFHAVTPMRAMDTRACLGGCSFGPEEDRALALPVPPGAVGAVLNVTVANASAAGFLTVYPDGGASRPNTSNLNFVPGQVVPNSVTVGVSSGGAIRIFNYAGTVDVIVDVMAYYQPDGAGPGAPETRTTYWSAKYLYGTPIFLSAEPTRYGYVTVPPGDYVVTANATISGTTGGPYGANTFRVTCNLRTDSVFPFRDSVTVASVDEGELQQIATNVSLMFAGRVDEGEIGLYCYFASSPEPFTAPPFSVAVRNWQLIATRVDQTELQGCPVLACPS